MKISLAPAKRSGFWSRAKRPVLLVLLILAAFILQNLFSRYFRIGNAVPYPLIAAVICIAAHGDDLYGTIFGLSAGLLWDCISPEVWGYHTLSLALTGLLIGLAFRQLLRRGFFSVLVICLISCILYVGFYWFFFIAMRGFDGAWRILVYQYFPSIIYTLLIFIPVYFAEGEIR